jgi:zeaxanthin glucosyltransferase
MARIGCICLPAFGHFNPLSTLARCLSLRGHEVTFLHVRDFEVPVRRLGLAYLPFGEQLFPRGTVAKRNLHLGAHRGLVAAYGTLRVSLQYSDAVLSELSDLLRARPFDLLVVDQADLAASAVVQLAGIPYVTAALCLMLNRERDLPVWTAIPFPEDTAQSFENRRLVEVVSYLERPLMEKIQRFRVAAGAGRVNEFPQLWSNLAQLTQMPAEFDFPRTTLPDCFHYTGPFHDPAARPVVEFPFERIDGRRLVYAAFGSMVNQQAGLFRSVAEACARLRAQLVISLGGGGDPESLPSLPGDPLVVRFAPQLELLRRASAMVTHAGLNSTLECLAAGVPMVAIPLTNDEPAIAGRIVWSGVGVTVLPDEAGAYALETALRRVLTEPAYRGAALRMKNNIERADGLSAAARLIEDAIGRPHSLAKPAEFVSG